MATIDVTSADGTISQPFEVDMPEAIPDRPTHLVLRDGDGREHHYAAADWKRETYSWVATYLPDGTRDRYCPYWDIEEALDKHAELVDEPTLGPILPPIVKHALTQMTRRVGTGKGFSFDYEKDSAVFTLRALYETAGEPLDPDEVEVLARTLGWSEKESRKLADIAKRVTEGRAFQAVGGGKALRRDPQRERESVDQWRRDLEGDASDDVRSRP